MKKTLFYCLLICLYSCNNLNDLKVKYEYQKESERKSQIENSDFLFVIGSWYQDDYVQVYIENKLIFSRRVKTNESVYQSTDFIYPKSKNKKYTKIKVVVNLKDTFDAEISNKYNWVGINYYQDKRYFLLGLWYDIISVI
jgi:hypothetical protein